MILCMFQLIMKKRPIYELGDGIQSIIILLYPLFFNRKKNSLVFIEEPENSMHPGFQRLFIETLMNEEFKDFQFFITTHSNHLLDITFDLNNISVYTFKKNKNSIGNSYLVDNTSNDLNSILDLIGVRNSSVFLSNCTIWVEGITDRFYIRRYLEVYQKDLITKGEIKSPFREDTHFSFIEYSGGNIAHWSFGDESYIDEESFNKISSNKISSKIFLLADKDNVNLNEDSAKAKKFDLLKKQLKENFKITDSKEIENTLGPKIIIQTIQLLEGQNQIAFNEDDIRYEVYREVGLGKFISDNFKNLKRKYNTSSGTIFCKLEFCKKAIKLINFKDDLTTEGLELARLIFNFIKQNNPEFRN